MRDSARAALRSEIRFGRSAMWKGLTIIFVMSLAILPLSCASSAPEPIQVIGAPEDLVPLTGEWIGTYDSNATGRSGSITFHLTESREGAHGDVLMVPKREFIYDRERHASPYPHGMMSSSSVLSIEFVRVSGSGISGKIAPYPDPETPEATLETHFTGQLDGDWIEGTFVTYSDRDVSPRRGTWRVHRKAAD
jgi:hypothetical protein